MGNKPVVDVKDISLVIPTYRRGRILLETVKRFLASPDCPGEILIVDQTEAHAPEVETELRALASAGIVKRLSMPEPSIPRAMNAGLLSARGSVVLFVDDDVEPAPGLVSAHAARHNGDYAAVCGQVLQPGEEPCDNSVPTKYSRGLRADMHFAFNGNASAEIRNVMAGNLSIRRDVALHIGGFDENYVGSAYRFETDFARRLLATDNRIVFAPEASLRHLRLSEGGTRSRGDHLRRPSPFHSAGDYYFALTHGRGSERFLYLWKRPFRECINRFYLRRPWLIPRKFFSELRAMAMARAFNSAGPRLIDPQRRGGPTTGGLP